MQIFWKYNRNLIFIVGAFLLLNFALLFFKYFTFLYTQLDLAIFTNALKQPWNQALYSTIQGHHYFGDHFAPYLFFIKPIFDLFGQSPIFLLILQTLIIASAAIPLKLILRRAVSEKFQNLLIILFLFNPATIGMNLYEFHPETLLLPFLLWLIYFYQQQDFRRYLMFIGLILLVREDSILAILPFSILAVIDRRRWPWLAAPLISVPYFLASLRIVGYFQPAGKSIFLTYFTWLGDSLPAMALGVFTHFPQVLWKLTNIHNLEFLLAGILFVFFLPILKPKYLILGFFSYLVLALGPGVGISIYRSHYSIPIFVGLVISAIFGWQKLEAKYNQAIIKHSAFISIMAGGLILFLNLSFGPYLELSRLAADEFFWHKVSVQRTALTQVDLDQPTLSSYQFLPYLRTNQAYFLGYALQKKQQYLTGPYDLPSNLPQMIIDYTDLVTFSLNSPQDKFNEYANELRELKLRLPITYMVDSVAIFSKSLPDISPLEIFPLETGAAQPLNDEIGLISLDQNISNKKIELKISLNALKKIEKNYYWKISYLNADGLSIAADYYPLALEYPTSRWSTDRAIMQRFSLNLSQLPSLKRLKLEIADLEGGYVLSSFASSKLVVDSEVITAEVASIELE